MKAAIVFGLIGVGFFCLVLGGAWGMIFDGSSAWTEEKGQRWSEVKNRLHNLSFVVNAPPGSVKMHGGPDMATLKQEYDELRKENEDLKTQFESAYNSPRTTSSVLKWAGIALAGVGIAGYLVVKE